MQAPQQQHGNEGRPDLDLDRIGRGAHTGLDLQVLLESFEEEFDLPPVCVDGGDRARPESQVIGEEDEDLILVRVVDLDPPERVRAALLCSHTGQTDDLILEDATVLRDRTVLDDRIAGVVPSCG